MKPRSAALSAVALLLAGCGAPTVYYRGVTTYAPGEYGGNVYLDVRGNPYKVPQEQLNTAVADAMSGGVWGTPVRFSPARDAASTSPYKVVMAFDPPWYASNERLCQQAQTVQPVAPEAGATKVSAVLCRSDAPISYVYAGFASNGPADPSFRSAIQQIELALLPSRNEHISRNGGGGDSGRR
jgi:hypothetical protein